MAMTGLDKITGKILAEAEKEAQRILAEAKDASRAIESDYREKADCIRADAAAEREKAKRELIARAAATAETSRRNLLLDAKGKLVDEVFANAEATVRAYSEEKMLDFLTGLLAYAMTEQTSAEAESISLYGEEDALAPDTYELLLNAKDRSLYGQAMISGVGNKLIGKVPTEKLARLRLSESTVGISGGFILRYGDIESNCSFDLLFAELRQTLEVEVSHALFDNLKKA